MLGSLTAPPAFLRIKSGGRLRGRLIGPPLAIAQQVVLPSDLVTSPAFAGAGSGTRDFGLTRLNGQPARSPADASPCPSRNTAHGAGPA
jgi:hypothetical protein